VPHGHSTCKLDPLPASSQTVDDLRAALPTSALWSVGGVAVTVSFELLHTPLTPLSELKDLRGWPLRPPEWKSLFPFGEMRFEGGASPLYCLSKNDGAIYYVDLELDNDVGVTLLNSSAPQFVDCFRMVNAYLGSGSYDTRQLLEELERCDVDAYKQHNEWRRLLEYVRGSDRGV